MASAGWAIATMPKRFRKTTVLSNSAEGTPPHGKAGVFSPENWFSKTEFGFQRCARHDERHRTPSAGRPAKDSTLFSHNLSTFARRTGGFVRA